MWNTEGRAAQPLLEMLCSTFIAKTDQAEIVSRETQALAPRRNDLKSGTLDHCETPKLALANAADTFHMEQGDSQE